MCGSGGWRQILCHNNVAALIVVVVVAPPSWAISSLNKSSTIGEAEVVDMGVKSKEKKSLYSSEETEASSSPESYSSLS